MAKIYEVAYRWYEDYSPKYVEGPEVDDWSAYCAEMLQESVSRAVENERGGMNSWVGWNSIADAMVDLLCERGYRRVEFLSYRLFGSSIIRDARDDDGSKLSDESRSLLFEHNNRVEKSLE